MKYLFLGGPADGMWITVNPKRMYYYILEKIDPLVEFIQIKKIDPIHITKYQYIQEHLVSTQRKEYIVYVHEDDGEIDIIDKLLKGYRR